MNRLFQSIRGYFDVSKDVSNLDEVKEGIVQNVSFRGSNIVILIIAIFIASLGLNKNSPAVIIGAMLISPLMGPIIGIGLGVGIYDFKLIKRSARNLAAAALFSVVTATIYFLISPVSEGRSELLARTSPNIYDVLIGFFGGAAGIVAIVCKNKGNVIPGVAIATALMPPLCTAGYGLATWQMGYFVGAFYLFIINSIFIAFATILGVKIFKFPKVAFIDKSRQLKVRRTVLTIVIVTLIPSIYLTLMMLRDSYFEQEASVFVDDNLSLPNTQVFAKQISTKGWEKNIDVTLIGEKVDVDSLEKVLTKKLDNSGWILSGAKLKINQGATFSTASVDLPTDNANAGSKATIEKLIGQLDRQESVADSLKTALNSSRRLDSLSAAIAPEIKVLYPSVSRFGLTRVIVHNMDANTNDTVNLAIVQPTLPASQLPRLREYLETRTGLKISLELVP